MIKTHSMTDVRSPEEVVSSPEVEETNKLIVGTPKKTGETEAVSSEEMEKIEKSLSVKKLQDKSGESPAAEASEDSLPGGSLHICVSEPFSLNEDFESYLPEANNRSNKEETDDIVDSDCNSPLNLNGNIKEEISIEEHLDQSTYNSKVLLPNDINSFIRPCSVVINQFESIDIIDSELNSKLNTTQNRKKVRRRRRKKFGAWIRVNSKKELRLPCKQDLIHHKIETQTIAKASNEINAQQDVFCSTPDATVKKQITKVKLNLSTDQEFLDQRDTTLNTKLNKTQDTTDAYIQPLRKRGRPRKLERKEPVDEINAQKTVFSKFTPDAMVKKQLTKVNMNPSSDQEFLDQRDIAINTKLNKIQDTTDAYIQPLRKRGRPRKLERKEPVDEINAQKTVFSKFTPDAMVKRQLTKVNINPSSDQEFLDQRDIALNTKLNKIQDTTDAYIQQPRKSGRRKKNLKPADEINDQIGKLTPDATVKSQLTKVKMNPNVDQEFFDHRLIKDNDKQSENTKVSEETNMGANTSSNQTCEEAFKMQLNNEESSKKLQDRTILTQRELISRTIEKLTSKIFSQPKQKTSIEKDDSNNISLSGKGSIEKGSKEVCGKLINSEKGKKEELHEELINVDDDNKEEIHGKLINLEEGDKEEIQRKLVNLTIAKLTSGKLPKLKQAICGKGKTQIVDSPPEKELKKNDEITTQSKIGKLTEKKKNSCSFAEVSLKGNKCVPNEIDNNLIVESRAYFSQLELTADPNSSKSLKDEAVQNLSTLPHKENRRVEEKIDIIEIITIDDDDDNDSHDNYGVNDNDDEPLSAPISSPSHDLEEANPRSTDLAVKKATAQSSTSVTNGIAGSIDTRTNILKGYLTNKPKINSQPEEPSLPNNIRMKTSLHATSQNFNGTNVNYIVQLPTSSVIQIQPGLGNLNILTQNSGQQNNSSTINRPELKETVQTMTSLQNQYPNACLLQHPQGLFPSPMLRLPFQSGIVNPVPPTTSLSTNVIASPGSSSNNILGSNCMKESCGQNIVMGPMQYNIPVNNFIPTVSQNVCGNKSIITVPMQYFNNLFTPTVPSGLPTQSVYENKNNSPISGGVREDQSAKLPTNASIPLPVTNQMKPADGSSPKQLYFRPLFVIDDKKNILPFHASNLSNLAKESSSSSSSSQTDHKSCNTMATGKFHSSPFPQLNQQRHSQKLNDNTTLKVSSVQNLVTVSSPPAVSPLIVNGNLNTSGVKQSYLSDKGKSQEQGLRPRATCTKQDKSVNTDSVQKIKQPFLSIDKNENKFQPHQVTTNCSSSAHSTIGTTPLAGLKKKEFQTFRDVNSSEKTKHLEVLTKLNSNESGTKSSTVCDTYQTLPKRRKYGEPKTMIQEHNRSFLKSILSKDLESPTVGIKTRFGSNFNTSVPQIETPVSTSQNKQLDRRKIENKHRAQEEVSKTLQDSIHEVVVNSSSHPSIIDDDIICIVDTSSTSPKRRKYMEQCNSNSKSLLKSVSSRNSATPNESVENLRGSSSCKIVPQIEGTSRQSSSTVGKIKRVRSEEESLEELMDGIPPFIKEVLRCENIRGVFDNQDLMFVLSLLPDIEEMTHSQRVIFQVRVIEIINSVFKEKD